MEIFINGHLLAYCNVESIRNGDYDQGEFVLVGDRFQFRMTHDERLELLDTLKIADAAIREQEEHDDDECEDSEGYVYSRAEAADAQMAFFREQRLHENARMAMREIIRDRLEKLRQPSPQVVIENQPHMIERDARLAYKIAHAMQQAFEQTQGGFTEAPASSETEAAVAHRETDVFVVRTCEGPLPIKRAWLEEKKQEYGPLDVYAEVRKAVVKLNERSQLSLIPGHVEALRYIESWLCSSRDF